MAQTTIANSTIAGVVSYPVVAAFLAAILAIAGVAIPPLTIGAYVLTQATDISIASALISYIVTHFTSDSVQQNIAALAKLAPKVLAMIPKTYSAPTDFPNPPPQTLTPSNIQNAALAVAVIQAHVTSGG